MWLGLVPVLEGVGTDGVEVSGGLVLDILTLDGMLDLSGWALVQVPLWSLGTKVVNTGDPGIKGLDSIFLSSDPDGKVVEWQVNHVLGGVIEPLKWSGLELGRLEDWLFNFDNNEFQLWQLVVVEELIGKECWGETLCELL